MIQMRGCVVVQMQPRAVPKGRERGQCASSSSCRRVLLGELRSASFAPALAAVGDEPLHGKTSGISRSLTHVEQERQVYSQQAAQRSHIQPRRA